MGKSALTIQFIQGHVSRRRFEVLGGSGSGCAGVGSESGCGV